MTHPTDARPDVEGLLKLLEERDVVNKRLRGLIRKGQDDPATDEFKSVDYEALCANGQFIGNAMEFAPVSARYILQLEAQLAQSGAVSGTALVIDGEIYVVSMRTAGLISRLQKAVAAAREGCAKIADAVADAVTKAPPTHPLETAANDGWSAASRKIAAAIRATAQEEGGKNP